MRIHDPSSAQSCFRKRRKRYEVNREPREFTFSCYHRFRFLERDRTREWFIAALEKGRQRWPVDVWAYVLMPEHVHLLVSPREPKLDLGRFAGFVKEQTARPAIRWLKDNAPDFLAKITVVEGNVTRRRFWQPGGGYDRNVSNEQTLESMIDYIHHNPVRRRLCERATDWEWSSARWYAGMRPVPFQIDATLPMMYDS
jgi:putative transposase